MTVLGGPAGLVDRARHRLDDLERRWSRFRDDSEISQLNRSTGEPVIVSPETWDVVTAAIEAWEWSGGRFDPTVGRTMELAGYDRAFEAGAIRTEAVTIACPTPRHLVLDPYPRSISVPAGVAIDLGGIGKGAAADLVADELLDAGAAGCCVNLGGDLRVAGEPPRPEGWRVAIDTGPGGPSLTVGVTAGAVCTSTRTLRTWTGPNGTEHHLRAADTGRSIDSGLRTVTVIAARALAAEVVAKTAFAAGPADAAAIVGGVDATGLLITDDGRLHRLDGLAPFLRAAGSTVDPVGAAA